MSGGDHNRGRTTKRFDKEELAALAKKARENQEAAPPPPRELPRGTEPIPSVSRTVTAHDPLTTQLLAEVARRAQTMDVDDETIEKLAEALADGDTNHPHTRKRKA